MKRNTAMQCRSCGRLIVWMQTVDGKNIPILADVHTGEAQEHEDTHLAGRIQETWLEQVPLFEDHPPTPVVRVLGNGETADPELPIWMTHFVDCKDAEAWRKKNQQPTKEKRP